MADFKAVLTRLHQNLNILRERESKFGGNAPLELLNQIEDHEKAIALTEQAIAGELSQVKWEEAMKPLLVAIEARSGVAAISVTIIGSGNIIVYNFGLAYQALKAALPENHLGLQGLVESLTGLVAYHELINERKELHNLLQELHNTVAQFYAEVDRLLYELATIEGLRGLRRQWHPCKQKIRILTGFAENIKHIWSEPYREESGKLYGPPWIVKIIRQQRDLEEILKEDNFDIKELYNLTSEFSHDCYWYLYQADKGLRDEVDNLRSLSNRILAKLEE